MDLPFLTPMFDDRVSVLFGIPSNVIALAVAWMGFTIGVLWLRRVLRSDPEPRAFRAANPERLPFARSLMGAVVISGSVLLALLAVAWLLRSF